ncbi:MAG TPA: iron-sulfur cluster assembly accessory protein [Polyangiaceae bacterium]|nr:iron-sulfur cluster assembly accessory protein [Polyangiaceae bacterium]
MTQTKALSSSETLSLTPAASKFLQRIVRFGGAGGDAGLRLEVSPGGCSGMSSQFSVERNPFAGDEVVQFDGLKLFLPPPTVRLLAGVTIDFLETSTEAKLSFVDPKAGACGCSSTAAPELPKGFIKLN